MSREYDVAIVGPGTVGIFLAAALAGAQRVALVGGALSTADLVGAAPDDAGHIGVLDGWAGGYGGTSTRWGGQLWPWQPWEVAGGPGRDRWPIDFATELAPHYRSVLGALGLDAEVRTQIHEHAGTRRWPELASASTEVRYSTWMDRRHRDFRLNRALQSRAAGADRIERNVARIEPRPGGRSALFDADGGELLVAAKVVLAAGTFGNIRALQRHAALTSSTRPVGHFFGDHLSTRAAVADVVDRARFLRFAAPAYIRHGRATTRLATTAAHPALPAYGHFEVASRTVQAARSLARARGGAVAPAAAGALAVLPLLPRQLPESVRAISARRRPLDPTGEVHLRIDVEQPLRRDAAVRWDDRGDLRLDWSIGDEERAATAAALGAFTPLLEAHAGVLLRPEEPALQDIRHLMGGTRMGAAGDRDAIVDTDLRVLDADGVWVAGASVFPSGGMANPTFTALALADRLAARLV